MAHIWVSKQTIIDSANGLSPGNMNVIQISNLHFSQKQQYPLRREKKERNFNNPGSVVRFSAHENSL